MSLIDPLRTRLSGISRLCDALPLWARLKPDVAAFRFLRGSGEVEDITFRQLAAKARAIADGPLAATRPGDRVLLPFRPGLDFVTAFFACQFAGTVPVPLPPFRPRELVERLPRLVADSGASLVLTHSPFVAALTKLTIPVRLIEDADDGTTIDPPDRPAADLAFIQYTSGSTGEPKGVAVSQANLLSNSRTITSAFNIWHDGTSVSWLPPHHDMGLVGGILTPVFLGWTCWMMAPADFVRAPLRWIELIARTGALVSGAPNFAYDLCAQRLAENPAALDGTTDLSAWRVAFCGAEPVRAGTLRRFASAFAPLGFDPHSFLPCYGLAEATLFVSGIRAAPPRLIHRFDTAELLRGRALPATDGQELVACGRLGDPDAPAIAIIDSEAKACPDGVLGEITVTGGGVAQGYWGHAELTATTFPDGTLRTGDLGFIHDGNLFVAGRIKDVIIHNGLNHMPEHIEASAVAAVSDGAPWPAAAFSFDDGNTERLVILLETPREGRLSLDPAKLADIVRSAVLAAHGVTPYEVILLRPGTLPRTTSGKVRRTRCRDLYAAGELSPIAPAPTDGTTAQSSDERLEGLVAVLATVLGIAAEGINIDRPVSALGLDSLKSIEVHLAIEDLLGEDIPIELLQSPLPLRELISAGEIDPGRYWADASLSAAFVPPAGDPDRPGAWLVTGGTGLVGARVIARALAGTADKVICIGRAGAGERLHARLTQLQVPAAALARLAWVEGDLAEPGWGIGPEQWERLAQEVGTIVHCAAELSFIKSYSALRAVNVEAGRSLLALMAAGRAKRMVHLSSVSVLESPLHSGKALGEDATLDFPETLAIGYARSKWVADRMMLHARERGFAVSVVRPPWIIGSTDDELAVGGDFLQRFLQACALAGAVPVGPFGWNVVDAGFVAEAVVAIVQANGDAATHHVGLAEPLPAEAMAVALEQAGRGVITCPAAQWLGLIQSGLAGGEDHPLLPLSPLFLARGGRESKAAGYAAGRMPVMDSRQTLARLVEWGHASPSPDLSRLARQALGRQ